MTRVTFNNKNASFYRSICKDADEYFTTNNKQRTGNWNLYSKTIILLLVAIALYTSAMAFSLSWLWLVVLGVLLGFTSACIGFNVMHDANHESYSSRKWINNTLALTINALGGNSFIWKYKHNIIHHTYPNVDGIDDDIAKSPFIRMCETQKWAPAHRYQHLYTPILYAVSSLIWVLFQDYEKYFRRKLNNQRMADKMRPADHLLFWSSKLLYVFFYLALPIMLLGWAKGILFFLALHAGLGFTLAIVFQLAHVVEETHFSHVEEGNTRKLENEWAIHQVMTTSNFSPGNQLVSWFAGGLNYQVEHHLFPKISHIHYPALSKLVRARCAEFNLPYHCIPSLGKAMSSHFRFIKSLGRRPEFA